ncbi:hypothetical protein GGI42DRAFT_216953 [Trichoderma sp. SZMC 28013]
MATLSIWWCRSWRPFGSLVLPETTGHLCLCLLLLYSYCIRCLLQQVACCRLAQTSGCREERRGEERRDETRQRQEIHACLLTSSKQYCLLPVQSLKVGFCESHGCLSSSPQSSIADGKPFGLSNRFAAAISGCRVMPPANQALAHCPYGEVGGCWAAGVLVGSARGLQGTTGKAAWRC